MYPSMILVNASVQLQKFTWSACSLTRLENQVEEHKKKQEKQFQNYITHDPMEFAKAKREASDLSDQGSKVMIDNAYWDTTSADVKHLETQALCRTEDAC